MSDINTPQLTREDLDGLSPAEIMKAKREGKLDALLGPGSNAHRNAINADPDPNQFTAEDLDGMSPAEIVSAKRAGRLDALLGR
ncbi:hypothetical protein ABZS81_16645 [Streptomyces sp. NPDC005318]|uniref:hypothetical protein n=1 Tax=Streptomyces sp. NPDC005318 TaxID=3157031 RepID=UPI00339DFBEF